MTIIVEDGSIVANANSYVTVAEARAYATARGVTLGVDAVVEAALISAADYTESKRAQYQGEKVSPDQELQFPRFNVFVDGFEIAPTAIPKTLKNAQMQLVIESSEGVDLMPTQTGQFVTEETVGPITTKYSDKAGLDGVKPQMTAVDALLEPLYKKGNSGAFLTTYRA